MHRRLYRAYADHPSCTISKPCQTDYVISAVHQREGGKSASICGCNPKNREVHINIKICAVFLFAIVLGLTAYFSGAKTFSNAYIHVFMLFLAVNVYDVVVLDIGLFCHSKKVRIPGTEDMEQAYRDPWFHVIGGFKGLLIGAVTALLSACVVQILSAVQ